MESGGDAMVKMLRPGESPPWELENERLLDQCRWEAYRGSGPGGQKRNKTSSAVRITHLPTKIQAIAEESRSQAENRARAMQRLRHKLAMELRRELDVINFQSPAWLHQYQTAGLHMAEHNPLYPALVALVLDVLTATRWEVARSAVLLEITTSALVRFIHSDGALWQRVNRTRQQLGMKPLTWDK